jgi:hypothetical protein
MRPPAGRTAGRLLLPLVVAGMAALAAAPPAAAGPDALTAIGPKTVLATWTGLPFAGMTLAGPGKCPLATDPLDVLCDHFSLKVNAPARYWQQHVGGTAVGIAWANPRSDFDLYVFDARRRLVARSALHRTTTEAVFVPRARGTYEIRVVPHHVVSSGYVGSAGFISVPAVPKPPLPTARPGLGRAAPVACGTTGWVCFDPRIDRASWFWGEQIDQPLKGKRPSGLGARVRLPSPQAKDTVPVALSRGRVDKTSALAFDLAERRVRGGTPVSDMVLTVVEAPASNPRRPAGGVPEFPSFDTAAARIEACPIAAEWARGAAEPMAAQPRLAGDVCVPGRRFRVGGLTEWRFDLSRLGSAWSRDARGNHGVLLRGVPDGSGAANTWQVNLKVPRGDDPATGANEYRQTRSRAWLELGVSNSGGQVPGTGSSGSGGTQGSPGTEEAGAAAPGASTSGGSRFSGVAGLWRTAPSRGGRAVSGGTSRGVPPGAAPVAASRPGPTASNVPWYVWLLPIEVLVAAIVRRLLLERSGGRGPSRGAGEPA